ncbi:hypothetical protein CC80DRAFT_570013 [Byssothecium circinans]|uniref:RING-type domain-containing protein n=1 Tax=Byssothecium circinans TaxID=147558 RepID=A0A6A5UBW7_9PLEO|nr:hypothetical protein CC80DRAFT_570013 [Byssothecium circinans]
MSGFYTFNSPPAFPTASPMRSYGSPSGRASPTDANPPVAPLPATPAPLPSQAEFLAAFVLPLTATSRRPSPGVQCSVCLEDLDTSPSPDIVTLTPCGHFFHTSCVCNWFTGGHPRSGSCPMCRLALFHVARVPENHPAQRGHALRRNSVVMDHPIRFNIHGYASLPSSGPQPEIEEVHPLWQDIYFVQEEWALAVQDDSESGRRATLEFCAELHTLFMERERLRIPFTNDHRRRLFAISSSAHSRSGNRDELELSESTWEIFDPSSNLDLWPQLPLEEWNIIASGPLLSEMGHPLWRRIYALGRHLHALRHDRSDNGRLVAVETKWQLLVLAQRVERQRREDHAESRPSLGRIRQRRRQQEEANLPVEQTVNRPHGQTLAKRLRELTRRLNGVGRYHADDEADAGAGAESTLIF